MSCVYINSSIKYSFIDVCLYIRLWCTILSRSTCWPGSKFGPITFKKITIEDFSSPAASRSFMCKLWALQPAAAKPTTYT